MPDKSKWYHPYRCLLPESREGNWRIIRGRNPDIGAGRGWEWEQEEDLEFTALQKKKKGSWKTFMTDSANEIGDSLPFVSKAYGHVLISGLGLGIVPRMLADKPNIESITILENAPEVIEMVKDVIPDYPSITIIVTDAFRWYPWKKFDCAFHDIWPSFGHKILSDQEALMARYDPFVTGFQISWLYEVNKIIKIYYESDPSLKHDTDFINHVITQSGEAGMLRKYLDLRDGAKNTDTWDTKTLTQLETKNAITKIS